MASLKSKVISGIFWTLSQQVSVKAVNFVVQIFLARMLFPADFGIIAMLQIFISIGTALMEGGMTSSLIRTKELDESDYSSVFFVNLIVSAFLYSLLFILAPLISKFYANPILGPIIRVYGISILLNALVSVQNARLTKNMQFKLQMYIEIPAVILSGISGLLLANFEFGVWSLVWMNLVYSFIFMIQHWFRTDWRPIFQINLNRIKYHFNFGYKITLVGLMNALYDNIYNITIGKFFSASQLGFYNRASTFQYFPAKNIGAAIQKVTYATFSSIQNDNTKLKLLYSKIIQQSLFWIAPLMVTLCIIAEPLFRFVLTEKWLPAVPYFQLLTLTGIIYPLNQYNLNIIWVKGRSDLLLKINIIEKIILAIIVTVTIPFGIKAMIIGRSIYAVIVLIINSHFSGKFINYTLTEQLRDITPPVLATISIGLIILLVNSQLNGISDWIHISIVLLITALMYWFICHLFKIAPYLEVRQIIDAKISKKLTFNP